MVISGRFEGSLLQSIVVPAVCVSLLIGCGGGGGGGGDKGGGRPSGIGPSGGVASSSDGRASVTVPAGALSQDTAIVVAVASNPPAGSIGTAYGFAPEGTNFSQPVSISISYDDTALPGGVTESNLTLGTVTNNQWTAVANATVDTAANVVSGTTTHFSVYGVIAVSEAGVMPPAPTGMTASAGDGQVTLSWAPVSEATSYNVYMAAQSGVTKSNYSTLAGGMAHVAAPNPFVHTALTNGTTYYFVVTAVNAIGESAESSEESATPVVAATAPNAPGGLLAIAVSSSQINLSWTDHADNEDGFRIERKTGTGGTYSQIATVGTNVTSYSNSMALTANTVYCYRLRAFNGIGNSAYSNESCATTAQSGTIPATPAGINVTVGDGQVTVRWDAVSGATAYNLYSASQAGVGKVNYDTLAGGAKQTGVLNTLTRICLTNGTTYYFVVTAVNATGESAESLEVTGTPTPGPAGTFSLTGNMSTPRRGHTATRLLDGRVLIAGGDLASTELYDPTTCSFNPTGSMITARSEDTATLLPNGKVLIAGGFDFSGGLVPLASAELYDPQTGTFSPTGKMDAARRGATATLLQNGKVLISGGTTGGAEPVGFSSAELYDPATGTFSSTGSMTVKRAGHRATLLINGKVLITLSSLSLSFSADLYDPTSGTFSSTGNLTSLRRLHTATLLPNGDVLVVGGISDDTFKSQASAELYDTETGTFSATGIMSVGRMLHTATRLPDGTVLVTGGRGDTVTVVYSSAEVYDAAEGSFSLTGSMSIPRSWHTATLLDNGKVLIAGGHSSAISAELYNPGTSQTQAQSP